MSRSSRRNVNFYNGSTGAHLGGVRQNGSISNANFFHMLMDVILVVDEPISIHFGETGERMPMNTDQLTEGDSTTISFVLEIKLTEEDCVRRVYSRSQSGTRIPYGAQGTLALVRFQPFYYASRTTLSQLSTERPITLSTDAPAIR
ncbi:hypothetical protein N7447_004997 [Penicillium robsamsonii]|uniref:uncharacterized protein n=1 Tax=Penicillium robsamsonii TaxID=1792511 RepID=UPI002549274C|nr:uncharacterized protein N7447_004997 [Penicillium robsamsonii]KAJ5822657.1 hypothetical protein N7447_004997 [Penicillium robsamsonii]